MTIGLLDFIAAVLIMALITQMSFLRVPAWVQVLIVIGIFGLWSTLLVVLDDDETPTE